MLVFVNVSAYSVTSIGGVITAITISKVVDCKEAAYVLRKCTRTGCNEMNMVPGSYVAASADHEWTFTSESHPVQKTTGALLPENWTFACWGSSYTSKNCTKCEQISDAVYANDQIKHYYFVAGVKTEIDTDCDAIAKYDGVKCELCGLEVIAKNEALNEYSDTGYIGANHKFVNDKKDPTCTEIGYNTTYCTVCKVEKGQMTTTLPFNPTFNPYIDNDPNKGYDYTNKVKALIETKAAAVGVEGFVKYVCKHCGLTHTYTLAALGTPATVTITTSAAAVTAGDTITATFKFANVVTKFNVLELVLNTDGMFNASDVNAVATGFGTEVEVIANGNNIMIYPANTAELVNLTADMTATVTLTLEAKGAACGLVEIAVTSATAKIVGENAPKDVVIDDKTVKVQISALGNANGDILLGKDEINAVDYREVYLYAQKVVTGEAEYAVKYDINRDGVVTMADARDLKTFVLSGKTVADYLNMLNYEFDKVVTEIAGVKTDITNSTYTAVIGLDLASVIVIEAE